MRFENLIALGAFAPTALVHGACLPIDADHPGARAVLSRETLLAPLAFFQNLLKINVQAQAEQIRLSLNGSTLQLTLGETRCTLNGEERFLPVAPRTERGLLSLPAVSVARLLGVSAREFNRLAVFADEAACSALADDPAAQSELLAAVFGKYNAAYFTADDFSKARSAWRADLCGTRKSNDPATPGMTRLLELRDEDSEALRAQMNRGPEIPILFGDTPPTESRDLEWQYNQILRMAQPYGTYGCRGYRSPELLADIVFALDWMHDHMYGANVLSDSSFRSYKLFNWWEWYVGGACPMMDTVMIVEPELSREQVAKYVLPMQFIRTQMRIGTEPSMFMSQILPLTAMALLTDDRATLQAMFIATEKLLEIHHEGSCMRDDWCCMTHNFPYNVCYGVCNLERVGKLLQILGASPLAFPCADAYHLMYMARYTFAPVVYRGQGLNMMNGRYMQESASRIARQVLGPLRYLFGLFGEQEDLELFSIIRRNASPEVIEGLIAHYEQNMTLAQYRQINVSAEHTQSPKTHIGSYAAYRKALLSPEFDSNPYTLGYMWHTGDSCVQFRRDYCFALRMSSRRLGGYESINSANGNAWYTGDGMLYLYTPGKAQYDSDWWRGTDMYHMPGVTADTQARQDVSIRYGHEYKNERDFVGGVDLDGQFLTTAMDFRSFHNETDSGLRDDGYGQGLPVHHCTLCGEKAWFFMDRAVAALGCGICAQDGYPVHTTVDNRLLACPPDHVRIDGRPLNAQEAEQRFPAVRTLHIPGVGGYFFPASTPLTVRLSEKPEGVFLTCWIDHGVSPQSAEYTYIVLPRASAEETAAYAAHPGMEILANTPDLQAVRESESGLTGYVFHKPGRLDGISAQTPLILMTHTEKGTLSLSACDPTQLQAQIAFSMEKPLSVLQSDPAITRNTENGQTQFRIDCSNAHGKGFRLSGNIL